VDALVIFFVPYYVYAGTYDVWGNSASSEGKNDGLWIFGTTVYTALVVCMFVRCALLTYTWTWMSLACFWFSLLFYFGFLLVYQVRTSSPLFSSFLLPLPIVLAAMVIVEMIGC
jgi:phospholipid-transporting ATPase